MYKMSSAIPDPEDIGKLFIGGLNSVTTKESLHNYFSQFGEVVDSVVMKNVETGRSRGFGFITFKDPNCVHTTLQIKCHELDGKKIDPKECTPRSMQKTRKQSGKCKVFMGGLPPDITEEAIRSAMSKFGQVDQVVIMYDQETKKCRGFGFLSFELEESIDQACAERFVVINDKQIELKKAEPRMYPKRPAQSFALQKNQNGFVAQPTYGQMAVLQQNNWNASSTQPLYNFQGNSVPDYSNYGNSGMTSFNTSSPAYPNVQAFLQQYSSSYGTAGGSYNFPAANSYTAVVANSLTSDANGSNNNPSNSYSQISSYGSPKGTYVSGNASDVAFINQGVSSSSYQRYHPYKA